MESKISEYVICPLEAFLLKFYYIDTMYSKTEVISGFLFTFITHKLREHLVGVFTVSCSNFFLTTVMPRL